MKRLGIVLGLIALIAVSCQTSDKNTNCTQDSLSIDSLCVDSIAIDTTTLKSVSVTTVTQ